MRLNDDGKTVAAMDVLAPGIGEIIGGSQREERLERPRRAHGRGRASTRRAYGWYRDLRRYGTVPHAGFGLGFERTVSYATGLSNVRDVIPFPAHAGERQVLMRISARDAGTTRRCWSSSTRRWRSRPRARSCCRR